MHRFALIDAENAESLGVVAFVRSGFKIGDLIAGCRPQPPSRQLLEAERLDQLPVLVVELADPAELTR